MVRFVGGKICGLPTGKKFVIRRIMFRRANSGAFPSSKRQVHRRVSGGVVYLQNASLSTTQEVINQNGGGGKQCRDQPLFYAIAERYGLVPNFRSLDDQNRTKCFFHDNFCTGIITTNNRRRHPLVTGLFIRSFQWRDYPISSKTRALENGLHALARS